MALSTEKLVTPLTATLSVAALAAASAWGAWSYLDTMRQDAAKRDEIMRVETASANAAIAAKVDDIKDQVSDLKHSSELGASTLTNTLERMDDRLQRIDETVVRVPDFRIWLQAAKGHYPELPDFPIR